MPDTCITMVRVSLVNGLLPLAMTSNRDSTAPAQMSQRGKAPARKASQARMHTEEHTHKELFYGAVTDRLPPTTGNPGAVANSEQQFDHWLREQFKGLLGWNVQEVLPEQVCDLIFT